MAPTDCPSAEQLTDFHLGNLPDVQLDMIASHVEGCAQCEKRLEQLSTLADYALLAVRAIPNGIAAQETIGRKGSSLPLIGTRVGAYEVLEEIGRGGMGLVCKARHVRLNRVVALKMLLSGEFASAEIRNRFLVEAEAIARLKHPNIVHIYEVGEWQLEGGAVLPFLALEYVEGGGLSKRTNDRPQPAKLAATWIETLAHAVQHAHDQGVIHRDLKPSNVLLTGDGRLKLCDFGVAKVLAGPDLRTQSGLLVGTPEYMAPEQASGLAKLVAPPADVWALGGILYTLLTGRPPFTAPDALGVLRMVLADEPVSPRALQPSVPRDLETVCLKCLRKEPNARYASAAELAADLRRFLDGQPVKARPIGSLGHATRWAKRHPATAALLTLLVSVTTIGAALVTWQWREAVANADGERRARIDVDEQRRQADEQRGRADQQRIRADEQRARAEERLVLALAAQYAYELELARGEYRRGNLARMNELLAGTRPELRGWEYRHLAALSRGRVMTLKGHQLHVGALAFSPDGKYFASGGGDEKVRVWEVAAGKRVALLDGPGGSVTSLAFGDSSGQSLLAAGSVKGVRVWRSDQDGWQASDLNDKSGMSAIGLSFSHDGRRLAVTFRGLAQGVGALRVFDLRMERLEMGVEQSDPRATSVAFRCPVFSPDGEQVAAVVGDEVRAWDVATRQLMSRRLPPGTTIGLAFTENGLLTVTAGPEGPAIVASATSGKVLSPDEVRRLPHTLDRIRFGEQVAFSPSGGRFVLRGDVLSLGQARLWDLRTGAESQLQGTRDMVTSLALSPSGEHLAVGDEKGAIAVWRLNAAAESLVLPRGKTPTAESVFVSETLLASAERGGQLKLWPIPSGFPVRVFAPPCLDQRVHGLAASKDGRFLAVAGREEVGVWEVPLIKPPNPLGKHDVSPTATLRPDMIATAVALRPDGRVLAVGSYSTNGEVATAKLFDVTSGKQLGTLSMGGKGVAAPSIQRIAFSPDGTLVALVGTDWSVRVMNAEGTARLNLPGKSLAGPTGVAITFSPDGKVLARSVGPEVQLWDLESGKQVVTFNAHTANIHSIAFSPDGKRIASGGADQTIKVWDPATGREAFSPGGHSGPVMWLAFSPEGKHLASRGADDTLRIWLGE